MTLFRLLTLVIVVCSVEVVVLVFRVVTDSLRSETLDSLRSDTLESTWSSH